MSYEGLQAIGLSLEMPRFAAGLTGAALSGLPSSPATRFWRAGIEQFMHATDRFALGRPGRPAFGLEHTVADGKSVPVHEEVVHGSPFCDLLHFRKDDANPGKPILVIAPMSGHHSTLLRGTVAPLLATSDVYITDWKNARDVPLMAGPFGLDDYVQTVKDYMRRLGPDLTVMAICQATVPGLAAACLLPAAQQPARLVLMGGPLDTRAAPTVVTRLAQDHDLRWFENTLIDTVPSLYEGAGRRVYPGLVQLLAFEAMNPKRHQDAHARQFQDRFMGRDKEADRQHRFQEEYDRVMDLSADFYLDTVSRVFQRQDMAHGRFAVGGELADPGRLRNTRVLVVEGERDDISAPGQTKAALAWMTGLPDSHKQAMLIPGAGHYGVFSGRRFETMVIPAILEMEAADRGPSARADLAKAIGRLHAHAPRRDPAVDTMGLA